MKRFQYPNMTSFILFEVFFFFFAFQFGLDDPYGPFPI